MTSLQYIIPESLNGEIDELETLIAQYQSQKINTVQLKAHRVPFGVYEQRVKGTFMVRIRCAAGIITPVQLRRAAQLSAQYGLGRLHLTTRQELQIHDVALESLVTVIRSLAAVGLSTRGGGGNTVRNITASADSGIAPSEVFDVTPHAVELTSRLIALGDSWLLPRKYKIAFSNSDADTAFATVNDLGFVARIKEGQRGFAVFVAGGMGRKPEPAHLLYDFAPESDVFIIAEALKRLFSKYGNRRNRHAARLRFVWNTLGRERFVELFEQEKAALSAQNPAPFVVSAKAEFPGAQVHDVSNNPASTQPEFKLWQRRFVTAHSQSGLCAVTLPISLGDITAENALALAEFLEPIGEETIRLTHDQNFALRTIPVTRIDDLYVLSGKISQLVNQPACVGKAVSCAGASTCQLGICLSRGALSAILDELKKSSIDLDRLPDFRMHVSGCANSCGQHGIAHLGFFGKARHHDGHSYPVYNIVAGARLDGSGGLKLADLVGEISARQLPNLVRDFLGRYVEKQSVYSSYHEFLDKEGVGYLKELSVRYGQIPAYEQDPLFYRDFGKESDFTLEGRGGGECAAGLFDLIDIDMAQLRTLRESFEKCDDSVKKNEFAHALAIVSMRALLIAKGAQASDDTSVPRLFEEHFVNGKLVPASFGSVVQSLQSGEKDLSPIFDQIVGLSQKIEQLHASLDDTLQFHPEAVTPVVPEIVPDLHKDFRGVGCPMNFVKTKVALSQIQNGQVLEILLDDGAPIENVPGSVAAEGHTVLSRVQVAHHWQVRIKKEL